MVDSFNIGSYIEYLRDKQGVTLDKLCIGLCSRETLSKIETGDRFPTIWITDRLIQRLGKSPMIFETIVFEDEYQELKTFDEIGELIDVGMLHKAEEELEIYGKGISEAETVRKQNLYGLQAVICQERGDEDGCMQYLMKAIHSTLPELDIDNLENYLLSTREIEYLLMWAEKLILRNEIEKAEKLLKILISYIEEHYSDDKEVANVFPKAVYLLVGIRKSHSELKPYIDYCEKAFQLLRNETATVFLAEIMEALINIYTEMNLLKKADMVNRQLEALTEVYEEFGHILFTSQYPMRWFKESSNRTYHLCREMILGERLARGWTREAVIEGIYDSPETLTRIENGKQNPKKKSFEQLMERLGLPTGKYNNYISTNNQEAIDLRKEISVLLRRREYEDAKLALERIRKMLDTEVPINRQYIKRQDAHLDYELKQIDEKELNRRIIEALEITYPLSEGKLKRVPLRVETDVLNILALSLQEQDKLGEALDLFERIYNCYKDSRIQVADRFISTGLIFRNYAMLLEIMGCDTVSKEILHEELELEFKVFTGIGMDFVLSELYCIAEKSKTLREEQKKKAMEKYLRNAFYLSDLFLNKSDHEVYDSVYKDVINADVRWYR